uniref:Cysteine-rich receptor-like protein kinase 29 n=1 Tax=Aegilops tauschii TaxID=37682 RepID=R7W071_AEGTA
MNADKRIPLHDLQKITNDFSEHSRIGRGGYGDVYKGVYNGREIAVKLLHVDTLRGLDDQLFKNEVGNLLKAEHPNIPANILLDSSMEPNVADFGLSRLFTQTHTHVTEKIIGTQKYMPPEFIKDHIISPKNDVFSVGVVMIEIMTGPTGYSNSFEMGDLAQLRGQVIDNWKNKINATSKYPLEESNQMETCIDTAMRCVEPDRNSRPTIAEVLDILNKTETHIPKRQHHSEWTGAGSTSLPATLLLLGSLMAPAHAIPVRGELGLPAQQLMRGDLVPP